MIKKNLIRLIFLLFASYISELYAVECSEDCKKGYFIQGLMFEDMSAFRTGCKLGHPESCSYAGWNKRINQDLRILTNEEFDFFERGCELGDSNSCYNYACILAERGKSDKALAALERSLTLDFRRWWMAEHDSNFNSIRKAKRFHTLVWKYKDIYITDLFDKEILGKDKFLQDVYLGLRPPDAIQADILSKD